MTYVGSKRRLAKYIAPIIQKCIDEHDIKNYYEPFVGGANMTEHIVCQNRYGNDIHKELIAMFKELQKGTTPPEDISREEYYRVFKNKSDYPDWYVGLVGFCATFGAKYFGGYGSDYKTGRRLSNERIRNLQKQLPKIQDVKFSCDDYKNLKFKSPAVIYCDPPYDAPTKYSTAKFNHDEFWEWAREISKTNYVFISEYNAPDDFECIWQTEINTCLTRGDRQEKRVEKLFVYKNSWN